MLPTGGASTGTSGPAVTAPTKRTTGVRRGHLTVRIEGIVDDQPSVIDARKGRSGGAVVLFGSWLVLSGLLLFGVGDPKLLTAVVGVSAVLVFVVAGLATLGTSIGKVVLGELCASEGPIGRMAPALSFRVRLANGEVIPVNFVGAQDGLRMGDDVEIKGYARLSGDLRATQVNNRTLHQTRLRDGEPVGSLILIGVLAALQLMMVVDTLGRL